MYYTTALLPKALSVRPCLASAWGEDSSIAYSGLSAISVSHAGVGTVLCGGEEKRHACLPRRCSVARRAPCVTPALCLIMPRRGLSPAAHPQANTMRRGVFSLSTAPLAPNGLRASVTYLLCIRHSLLRFRALLITFVRQLATARAAPGVHLQNGHGTI